jgi:hypothetical protein
MPLEVLNYVDAGHALEGRMEIEATMYSCKTKCEFISQMN